MDALTPILIAKALDGLSARALATAQNIANANTPNYRPLAVRFEQQLQAAAQAGADQVSAMQFRTGLTPMPRVASEMRLDLELATASQTAMRYAALIDVLGRSMALDRAVVEGAR